MKKTKKKATNAKRGPRAQMSQRTKVTLLVGVAGIIVIGGIWWSFYKFTTIAPPELAEAPPAEVTEFLGNPRGYARMSYDEREQFLARTYEKFAQGNARAEFNAELRRMSSSDLQVFQDATFEVGKVRLIESAKKFNRLSKRQQPVFIDNAIRNFEQMQQRVGGFGGSDNMGEPFKAGLPSSSDELTKTLVSRTSARERAEAQPFVDSIAARQKQLKDPNERARFNQDF